MAELYRIFFLILLLFPLSAVGTEASSILDYIEGVKTVADEEVNACAREKPLTGCLNPRADRPYIVSVKYCDSLVFWSDNAGALAPEAWELSKGLKNGIIEVDGEILYTWSTELEDSKYRFFLPLCHANVYGPLRQFGPSSIKFPENTGICFQLEDNPTSIDSMAEISQFLSIDSENVFVDRKKSGSIFWFIFFNTGIFLTFLFSGRIIQWLGNFWGTMMVVASVLTLRIIAVQPLFTKDLRSISLFSDTHFNEYFNSSVGDLLLNTILFFAISFLLLGKLYSAGDRRASLLKKMALTITNYASILFGIQILAFLVRNLLLEANIPLQMDRIFSMDWGSIMVVGAMVFFVNGLFFLNYLLTHNISKREISPANRAISLLIGGLLTLPVLLLLDLNISPFAFYALSFAYILLLDVFTDSKNISISWLVIWLLFLSGATSVLLYNYYLDSIDEKKKNLALKVADYAHRFPDRDLTVQPAGLKGEEGISFAIYNNNQLNSGDVNIYPGFYNLNSKPALGAFQKVNFGNHEILLYSASPKQLIAVGKKPSSFINSISLFSFVFTVFVLVSLAILLLNTRIVLLPEHWRFVISGKPSLRKRIQIVLFSLLIITFIAICFFTIYFFSYNETREQNEKITAILTRTVSYLTQHEHLLNDLAVGKLDRPEEVKDIEILTGSSVLLFNTSGQIVERGDVHLPGWPYRLPFSLYNNLVNSSDDNDPFSGVVQINDYEYAVAYTKLNESKRAFVGIPLTSIISDSTSPLNDFLGTLLNMYIFMLIVAGSIALAFADSITRPLSKLSQKFKEFKLGGSNDPIQWDGGDELGGLIQDYNRMIEELDDSAKLLAITERELAWREMARQVAHEIKNPLTPMKLSIQHLQYAIKQRKGLDAAGLVDRVSQTLVEQIDNLSNIASEFSNFAKLPKPENEKIVLNDVVANAHDLFRKREDMDISLYVPIDEIYVFADRHHLIRVLNNLLKNAIQAIPAKRRGRIEIKVYKENDAAIIQVSDNGVGIPDSFRDKVFKPNFTSKNSGSGLGLAICSNIVETFNGRIYFESEEGVGTDFYVQIPLMHTHDNYKYEQRVTL